ncbi:hypothetical protein PROFUN_03497 [Planoprotostelium fungivorum]|uniref:Calcineurin-like phosphoesterase domain-containing protein n=1 Tax=Planoprotostelium fungivorum TaxID=1890364 RepID=A0A2P6MNA5_9EUKA|nr:hypothetical protein PROFUN_03497 [Planoprotostelium fungivorum]
MGAGSSSYTQPNDTKITLEDIPKILHKRDLSEPHRTLRVVCISDTHTRHADLNVPDGDILIHSGESINSDIVKHSSRPEDLEDFNRWLGTLPHRYRLVTGGNHDKIIDNAGLDIDAIRQRYLSNCTHYLKDTSVEIEGIKIYGSPWHGLRPFWYRANAFGRKEVSHSSSPLVGGVIFHTSHLAHQITGLGRKNIETRWNDIPEDTDIVITHVPPEGVRDWSHAKQKPEGSPHLTATDLLRVKPKAHIFGHCHGSYGISRYDSTKNVDYAQSLRERHGMEAKEEEEYEIYFFNAAQAISREPLVFEYIY